MTYTYATLAVSEAVFKEIADKLKDVDYGHAILDDGKTLDMHGIALVKEDDK